MAQTNFIKFCGFIAHSKPNSTVLSAFPGVHFYFQATLGLKEVLQSSKKFYFYFFMVFDSIQRRLAALKIGIVLFVTIENENISILTYFSRPRRFSCRSEMQIYQ